MQHQPKAVILIFCASFALFTCINAVSTNNSAIAKTKDRTSSPSIHKSVIESQIDGDFEGWEGETIFKLVNGQIWQQSSYSYTYHYAYMPQVIIYPSRSSSSGYKMKVDGVDEAIDVIQLK